MLLTSENRSLPKERASRDLEIVPLVSVALLVMLVCGGPWDKWNVLGGGSSGLPFAQFQLISTKTAKTAVFRKDAFISAIVAVGNWRFLVEKNFLI